MKVELRQCDLHAPQEEGHDAVAAAVGAGQEVVPWDVPHDVLVQVLIQPYHVASDEGLVAPPDEFDILFD